MPRFLQGLNLPWVRYGLDFGANVWQPEGGVAHADGHDRLWHALDRAAALRPDLVRWFLLCDGRAGIRFAADGDALGLDTAFFADLDAAVAVARDQRLRLLFVLLDFLWLARPRRREGVQAGGRRRLLAGGESREGLLANVIEPILARYGREPAIAGWDVINEPEWATLGLGSWDPRAAVTPKATREFIGEVVALVRQHTSQQVTVGLASAAGLNLVRGAGLDFYQVHWYDKHEARAALERPVTSLELDRPLLLGEYPTRGSRRTAAAIVDAARRSGYAGALAWSLLAEDAASDAGVCEMALGQREPEHA